MPGGAQTGRRTIRRLGQIGGRQVASAAYVEAIGSVETVTKAAGDVLRDEPSDRGEKNRVSHVHITRKGRIPKKSAKR